MRGGPFCTRVSFLPLFSPPLPRYEFTMSTTIERVSEEEVAFDLAQFIKKHLLKVDDAHKAAAAKATEDVTNIVGNGDMSGLLAKVVSEDLILNALLHSSETGGFKELNSLPNYF